MKVVFRADASLQIGSGHIMRCLTLADELRAEGAECHFICREHPGHLVEFIRSKGFTTHSLPMEDELSKGEEVFLQPAPIHARWLGATQQQDAEACEYLLIGLRPDWIIIDHYALDISWEKRIQSYCQKVMVIDDLADRHHICDTLLDQNLGRLTSDYSSYISSTCTLLVGPDYALLRPEFSELREFSLSYRKQPKLKSLLITMGGVDEHNATGEVLEALKIIELPSDIVITVVMGAAAPWLADVQRAAKHMPFSTKVVVNVSDMAQRMAVSDLAIGAAGSTSWERCCLGLPTLMAVLADNQIEIGNALHARGAAILVGRPKTSDFVGNIVRTISAVIDSPEILKAISSASANITDGSGCKSVVSQLIGRYVQ